MGFFSRARLKPSLEQIGFDASSYTPRETADSSVQRAWTSSEGDGIGLYLFNIPPDLPKFITTSDVRRFYESQLAAVGGAVVEMDITSVSERVPAVRLIAKVPQKTSGMTYIGSLTVPFRDFSFVLKVQCEERGVTGIREAALFAQLPSEVSNGEAPIEVMLSSSKWDPDSAHFDPEFPDHPVSRVRRTLGALCSSVFLDPAILEAPAFPMPKNAS